MHGPVIKDCRGILARPTPPQAAPLPILGPFHQTRPQGIAFDIAGHRQKMLILLHRKTLAGALVDVAPPVAVAAPVPAPGAAAEAARPPAEAPQEERSFTSRLSLEND